MALPPVPAGPQPSADPSMEDILASIRKILNEDDAGKAPGEAVGEAVAEPHLSPGPLHGRAHPDDVLMLDESMMVPTDPLALPAPAGNAAAALPAPEPALPEPAQPGPVPPVPMPPPAITAPLATPLVSPAAAGAASGSVDMLVRTLTRERTTATHRGGPTIEDVVREEMRPLLREWLETHLPPMVERLVRAEIERVVNRTSL